MHVDRIRMELPILYFRGHTMCTEDVNFSSDSTVSILQNVTGPRVQGSPV